MLSMRRQLYYNILFEAYINLFITSFSSKEIDIFMRVVFYLLLLEITYNFPSCVRIWTRTHNRLVQSPDNTAKTARQPVPGACVAWFKQPAGCRPAKPVRLPAYLDTTVEVIVFSTKKGETNRNITIDYVFSFINIFI